MEYILALRSRGTLLSSLIVTFLTFFIALVVSIGSEALMRAVNNTVVAFILLLLIILSGIIFDIIGTAATAAQLPPFNAKAAKRVFGATQAVKITKNASIVANYTADVVGDIAGTLSGAVGAGIVYNWTQMFAIQDLVLTGAAMTSFIAALTVGGKAIGKSIAVRNANSIIFKVAVLLGWWEQYTGLELFREGGDPGGADVGSDQLATGFEETFHSGDV